MKEKEVVRSNLTIDWFCMHKLTYIRNPRSAVNFRISNSKFEHILLCRLNSPFFLLHIFYGSTAGQEFLGPWGGHPYTHPCVEWRCGAEQAWKLNEREWAWKNMVERERRGAVSRGYRKMCERWAEISTAPAPLTIKAPAGSPRICLLVWPHQVNELKWA